MNRILLTLALVSLALAIRWRGYDDGGNKVVRVLRVIRQPPLAPYTYELRAVERDGRGRKSVKDAVDLLFSVNALPHYTIRHFERDEDSSEKRAARHGLRKLVEYTEKGAADSGFNPEEDDVVQSYYLWFNARQWSVLSQSSETLNGAAVTKVCSHSNDNVVELCAYFTDIEAQLTVNGTAFTIDNNAIHHTLTVRNFPFIGNNTRLALKVHFESRTVVRDLAQGDTSANENGAELVDQDGENIRPVAAWAKTVDLTGNSCPATANVVRDVFRESESSRDVDVNTPTVSVETSVNLKEHITYFSFLTTCQPDYLFWDPDIGIVDDSSSARSLVSSLLIVFAALSAILL